MENSPRDREKRRAVKGQEQRKRERQLVKEIFKMKGGGGGEKRTKMKSSDKPFEIEKSSEHELQRREEKRQHGSEIRHAAKGGRLSGPHCKDQGRIPNHHNRITRSLQGLLLPYRASRPKEEVVAVGEQIW